ncbi:hypothetical protein [Campylobacter sp. RM16190]|uniref:hypothetical protein n=1 Tax=Campylobacter sp. RM16190 TaxID=1705727 RepID=UPI00147575DA|nr:hypothetical protein [Campylobacter sp. RM16190]
MKKILLLALMAGLVFGECRKHEIIDKMTDEKHITFSCEDKDNGSIIFYIDKDGKPDYTIKKAADVDMTLSSISFLATENLHRNESGMQTIVIRVDKNKAYFSQMEVADDFGWLFDLTQEQLQEIKSGNTLLIQYKSAVGKQKIAEIDISGMKKYQ